MNMQKKAELLAAGEQYLMRLEASCEEELREQHYSYAELLGHEYSGALRMLEALGLMPHRIVLEREAAFNSWRWTEEA